jgi:hypothetical protein
MYIVDFLNKETNGEYKRDRVGFAHLTPLVCTYLHAQMNFKPQAPQHTTTSISHPKKKTCPKSVIAVVEFVSLDEDPRGTESRRTFGLVCLVTGFSPE